MLYLKYVFVITVSPISTCSAKYNWHLSTVIIIIGIVNWGTYQCILLLLKLQDMILEKAVSILLSTHILLCFQTRIIARCFIVVVVHPWFNILAVFIVVSVYFREFQTWKRRWWVSSHQGFHWSFQQGANWFSVAVKPNWSVILYEQKFNYMCKPAWQIVFSAFQLAF